jgi:hypothetical protein
MTENPGKVSFLDDPPLKKIHKPQASPFCQGNDHHPARPFVEAVDDPRSKVSSENPLFPELGEMMQKTVNKGLLLPSSAGVDNETRRFIHHHNVGIRIEDRKGEGSGRKLPCGTRMGKSDDLIPGFQTIICIQDLLTVD